MARSVNTSNPLLRFAVGVLAVVVALRLAVDLIRPVAGWLVAGVLLFGLVVLVRWWRLNRW